MEVNKGTQISYAIVSHSRAWAPKGRHPDCLAVVVLLYTVDL